MGPEAAQEGLRSKDKQARTARDNRFSDALRWQRGQKEALHGTCMTLVISPHTPFWYVAEWGGAVQGKPCWSSLGKEQDWVREDRGVRFPRSRARDGDAPAADFLRVYSQERAIRK